MSVYKKYVDMIVRYYPDGTIRPMAVWWEEGKLYEIDRILDVRPAASLKAGGAGIRYTCRIQGHETYIWLEDNRWFVEAKGKPRSQEVS
ncbi:MAG: Prophage protein [Thermocaproicibacter melissae]|jgi:hypothetical protein|uniref:hypothetical protein n=1 Tax=Thermocaproicibacter melissae TaxID=2966552 RepID=UPI0024B17462|nr:hypothetical protein [Thermocaproicibacter melissae]WBY64468.1 hypothetical protein NOG13_01780 [Thermocaproicibacter melissae]